MDSYFNYRSDSKGVPLNYGYQNSIHGATKTIKISAGVQMRQARARQV